MRPLADHARSVQQEALQEPFAFDDVPRLSAALKRGDETAFAWLHDEWSGRINRYCFALASGDAALAFEIAQAAWLRLVRHARVREDEAALWNWIACAARHAAADLRRVKGRYFKALKCFSAWWRPSEADEADGCLLAALEAALGRLTDGDRALLESRYFAGESLEIIGARHGFSIRAVEGRLARLRVRLRELITKELKERQP